MPSGEKAKITTRRNKFLLANGVDPKAGYAIGRGRDGVLKVWQTREEEE